MVGGHTCGDPKRRSKDMRSLLHHLSGVGAERLGCDSPGRDAESAGAGGLPERLLCLLKLLRHNLDQLLKLDELLRQELQELMDLMLRLHCVRTLARKRRYSYRIDPESRLCKPPRHRRRGGHEW